MKIFICDDELSILASIKSILTVIDKNAIIKTFNNSKKLQTALKENIDILFMDIKLNDTNGIDFIKQNGQYLKNTKIIYITGYSEYIEDIFETNPIYFLQKPLTENKIIKAYKKALNKIKSENIDIIFKTSKETIKMKSDSILFIESKGRLVEIHTNDEVKTIYLKLANIENEYNNSFVRIHKSFLVNINKIKIYKYNKVILENNSELPISRTYQKSCKEKIMSFMENDYE